MSESRGIWCHSGQLIPRVYVTFHIRSDATQPRSAELASCISAVQGFKKLRLLEVVLPHSPHTPHLPQLAWESQTKEHAVTVLEKISGHTKMLKMISIGSSSTLIDVRDAGTQITTIP